jgi:hypothetical protein
MTGAPADEVQRIAIGSRFNFRKPGTAAKNNGSRRERKANAASQRHAKIEHR